RLSVIFRNPSPSEAKEDLVAEFRPGVQLALVSLPVATNREESAEVWRSILAACFTLAARKLAPGSGPAPVYVFFGAVSPLSVVERIYHYQTRKYRATDKFTGGLNRKLIRLEEKRIS
ncbi:MAG: hypothetical protein ABI782_09440, partial [Anaerolineaceae bacterium]